MTFERQVKIAGYIALGLFILMLNYKPLFDHFMWVMTLMGVIVGLPFFASTLRTFKAIRDITDHHPEDVSQDNYPPTQNAARLIAHANQLGFTRLGETRTSIPGSRKTAITWILTSVDQTDTAEVIDLGGKLPAMLQFSTTFMDEAVLETLYPIGQRRDFPLLRVRFSTSSVAVAYEFHCQERLQMQKEHGLPRPFASMIEYLNWEMRYRELHGRAKLSRSLVPSMLMSLFLLTMIVFGVYSAITIDHPDLLSDKLDWALFCAMIGTALIVGLVGISATRHSHYMEALIKATKKRQDQTNKQAQKGRLK